MDKEKLKFLDLKALSFAILTAPTSLSVITQSIASPVVSNLMNDDTSAYRQPQKRVLRAKLVLKLNIYNPDSSYMSMHSSHASHASHASSSPSPGHSSHSSHMSSSPSYSPITTAPIITVPKVPDYVPSEMTSPSSSYILGSRTLFRGCTGADVEALQRMLIKLGYDVISTGNFEHTTEIAVKKFQAENQLKVDGKVGSSTLIILQSKI